MEAVGDDKSGVCLVRVLHHVYFGVEHVVHKRVYTHVRPAPRHWRQPLHAARTLG